MPFNIARRLFGIKEGETNQKVYDPAVTRGDLVAYDDALPISGGVTSVGTTIAIPTAGAPDTGATIDGPSLRLYLASQTYSGIISTGTQTFAGNKTFLGDVQINTSQSSVVWKTQIIGVGSTTLYINSTSFNCTTQRIISSAGGTACTIFVSTGPEAGSQIDIIHDAPSAGAVVAFDAGPGMTVYSEFGSTPKLATRYTAASIIYTASNVAYIFGKLSA